jgi:hypothetical protein
VKGPQPRNPLSLGDGDLCSRPGAMDPQDVIGWGKSMIALGQLSVLAQ